MNFHDLEAAVRDAGLDVRRQLSILQTPATGRTDPEVAFNVVAVDTGFEVIAGVGRGEVATKPYEGYVFATESDVCSYVWRRIKTVALPHLLDDAELEANRTEAVAILARRSAGRNEP